MNKRRYKVSLAVERIREIAEFLNRYKAHRSLSSQERRHIERTAKELTKASENSNSPTVWVKAESIGDALKVFLAIYESMGVTENKIK